MGKATALSVVVSTEKDGLIEEMAADFNDEYRGEDGGCAEVEVFGVNSGEAAEAIADGWVAPPDDRLECKVDDPEDCEVVGARKPDLWLPTESVWPKLLAAGELGEDGAGELAENDGEWTSVASSVLTILMPEARREKLSGSPDWDELLTKAAGGELSIAIDDPIGSTSGMATSVALNEALVADHNEEDAVGLLRDAIASVPDELAGEDITRLMNRVYQNPDLLAQMDAVVAQEQTAYLYNCQDPLGSDDFSCRDPVTDEDRRMVAVSPDDTIYAFDHPAVPMASLDSDDAKRAASEAFVEHLRTRKAQQEFRAWGFRAAGEPEKVTDELQDVVDADDVESVTPWPEPKTVNQWRHQWQNVRLPVRVLLSVDTSGSMEQINGQDRRVRLDGFTDACTDEKTDNPTYLQVAKSAALNAIGELKDGRDSVGLDWFPLAGKDTSTEIKPLSGATRAQLKREICELTAFGETPLYDAIRDGSASVDASETEVSDRTVIVLLSDGGQNPPQSLDALMEEIGGEGAVPVIAVGIGDQAPIDVLGRLTEETGGALRNLSEPADVANLDRVLVDVFQGLAGKVS
ncbi:MAG: substrate-binding and vWA domain-containing protein [Nocardioides sp.]|uniref:substrate-binding and vWA domain-containing protein n=1 Tax=Nocardioides sp. TaxID=35761 RepID=UPI003D6AB2B2